MINKIKIAFIHFISFFKIIKNNKYVKQFYQIKIVKNVRQSTKLLVNVNKIIAIYENVYACMIQ